MLATKAVGFLCRKWDADLVDALLPQLLPKLSSNIIRSCDVSWKVAAVRGFLSRFHLQVYHRLSHMLVIYRQTSLIQYLSVCVVVCIICINVYYVY